MTEELERDVEIGDYVELTLAAQTSNPYSGERTQGPVAVSGRVVDVDDIGVVLASAGAKETLRVGYRSILSVEIVEAPTPDVGRLDPETRPVIVRVYPGRTQTDAANLYADEARYLARHGYIPTAQSWAVGEPGIGRIMALGVLGSTAMRPKGALTVTYVHRSLR